MSPELNKPNNQQLNKYLQTNCIVRIWRNIVVDKCSVYTVRGESSTVRREFVGLRRAYLARDVGEEGA